MDSVRDLDNKVEERSNSFFDENDEERILAEVQRRYQGDGLRATNGLGINAQGTAPLSSFGKLPEMVSTEQFMKDMGVMNTEQLKDESA